MRRRILAVFSAGANRASIAASRTPAIDISVQCTLIADRVEPRYRSGLRPYCCGGHVAKLWQAAWDGACTALGGDPASFLNPPQVVLKDSTDG